MSLQGESARENASACRTFMHRDRCRVGRTALIGGIWSPLHPMTTVRGRVDVRVERVVVVVSSFVPIFPLGGSTVVQVGRWRHC